MKKRKYHLTFLRRVCATTSHPTHPAIIFRLRRLASPTSERERCHPGPRRPITAGPIYDPSFPEKKYKKRKEKNPPPPFFFAPTNGRWKKRYPTSDLPGRKSTKKAALYGRQRRRRQRRQRLLFFSKKLRAKITHRQKGIVVQIAPREIRTLFLLNRAKSKVQKCTLLFVFRNTQSLNFVPGRRMFYESAATKNERREGRADKKE